MSRFNITAKIWLSIGVFVIGFLITTAQSRIQGLRAETSLRNTSEGLFPAAQQTQEAEAAFERMVRGFREAVVMQDASSLDTASEDGRQATAALAAIAVTQGLAPGRAANAGQLAAALGALVADARETYGQALSRGPNLDVETQAQMRSLATRTEHTKSELARAKEGLAADLHEQLRVLNQESARARDLEVIVFGCTLILAGAIVRWTIRRVITGPISEVIGGVEGAAAEAARASNQIVQSGQEVSNNAHDEASCVAETSASLDQISSTTRQNADRARAADGLMQEARGTVDRAAHAMNDLTASMGLISKSSNQVAGVLRSIDEIAFHTNILALNAAVEAARAGETGAGFSVVANEVRALAHRAAEAARNSAAIIEETIGHVLKGVELVGLAHQAFQEVSTKIAGGTQMVSEIAAGSAEQARGIAHIGQAMARIEAVTQRNAATAERTSLAAAEMTAQVETTRQYLGQLVAVVGVRRG